MRAPKDSGGMLPWEKLKFGFVLGCISWLFRVVFAQSYHLGVMQEDFSKKFSTYMYCLQQKM